MPGILERIGMIPPAPPVQAPWTEDDEEGFREWYGGHASRLGLSPDPDDPKHFYDYRAAFRAGAAPDESGHWPSDFKEEGHPRRYVLRDGKPVDTATGRPTDSAEAQRRAQAAGDKGGWQGVSGSGGILERIGMLGPKPEVGPTPQQVKRAELEAAKAGGAEQFAQIEASRRAAEREPFLPQNLAASAGQFAAEVGKGAVKTVRDVGRLGQRAVEMTAAQAREAAEKAAEQGVPFARPAFEAAAGLAGEVEQFATGSRGHHDPREAWVERTPGYIPDDFWEGMKTDPAKTLAIHGVENLGPLVAALGATAAAGPAGGIGTAYLMEAGGAYEEAIEAGAAPEQATEAAGLTGLGNMMFEYLPAGRLLQKTLGKAPKKEVAGFLRDMAGQAMSEGVTESVQELNNLVVAANTYIEDKEWGWEDVKRIGASGILGFVLGAATGGAAAAAPAAQAAQPEVEAAPEPVAAPAPAPKEAPQAAAPPPEAPRGPRPQATTAEPAPTPPQTPPPSVESPSPPRLGEGAPGAQPTFRRRLAEAVDPSIREEAERRQTAERERDTDALTGLPNRRALDRALPTAEADPGTAVVVFDADNFGQINKLEGQEAGDAAIRRVAEAVRAAAGEAGVPERVFRRGGDEIVALVPAGAAEQVRERAEAVFGEQTYGSAEAPVRVSLSGAAGETFRAADEALRARKAERKAAPAEPEAPKPQARPESERLIAKPEEPAPEPDRSPEPAAAGVKSPREMTAEELDETIEQVEQGGRGVEEELFGVEGAKRYALMHRRAESVDRKRADAASAEIERMEGGLTEAQQRRLFGMDDTYSAEELKDFRRAISDIDGWGAESPQELGAALRWAVTEVRRGVDPSDMSYDERLRYAQLRRGFEIARERGWDTAEVSEAAAKAAGARFSDPEDARFMLSDLLADRPKAKALPEPMERPEPAAPSREAKPQLETPQDTATETTEAVESYEKAGQEDLFGESKERSAIKPSGSTRSTPAAPAWLSGEAETKPGKKLVEAIRKDPGGRESGVRSIADFLVTAARTELRVGREQTTPKNPAHYQASAHIIRSRSGNNIDYISHEIGHAVSALLRDKNPMVFKGLGKDLEALAKRPGSMASAKSAEEGVAEWVRLSIADPGAIEGDPLTPKLVSLLTANAPETLGAIRDAARAYNAHMGRTLFSRFRSHSRTRPSPSSLASQIRDAWHRVLFLAAARRSAIDRMDRNVWRAALQAAKRGEMDRHAASNAVRRFLAKISDTEADLHSAYQSVLHGSQEVEGALLGRAKKEKQGLRIRKTGDGPVVSEEVAKLLRDAGLPIPAAESVRHGDWIYLTEHSAQDIVERLGDRWEDFETYAQARVALDRYRKKGHEYPGYPNDPSPQELEDAVKLGNSEAGFDEAFKDFQEYADGLLSIGVLGGLVQPEAAARMKAAYDDYLPLIREQERELGFPGGSTMARPGGGFQRAFGGQQPFVPLLEALETRTQQVIAGYYANRAVLAPIRAAEMAAKDESLPKDARDVVARVATRLKLDQKITARLTPDEGRKIIADFLNDTLEEGAEPIRPEDVDLYWNSWDIWRAVEPKAIRIVAPVINGKRAFYQVEDPILYDLFAHTSGEGGRVSEIFDLFTRWAVGMRRPWKRILTQNIVFAIRNIGRDTITGNFFGEDPESFAPGFYSMGGLIRQLTGRTPEGSSAGELLSRAFETTHSPAHRARVGKFQEIVREGIIPDNWRRLSVAEKVAEMAGPIPMAAMMKPVEIALWATGQRKVAQLTEEASRLQAYATTLKRGGSHEAAQMTYDYVTGNFGDQPASHFISQLYRIPGFVNPAMQITYEIGHRLSHPDPKVRAAHWVKAGPWIMTMTAIGWAVNRIITPDDKEEEMAARTDTDRSAYMVIGGYLRVPFDYGLLGAVQSWTWNSLDSLAGDGPRSKMMARLLLRRASDLPIGGPMSFMQPQIKALLENESNYQWHWAEEIEPHWMKYLPADERAYWSTPRIYKSLARFTGVGPLKIQHFVQAGMAYQLDEAIKLVDRIERGERIEEPADTPFVGRLFQRQPRGWASAPVQEVADLDQKYQAAKERLSALRDSESASEEEREAAKVQLDSLKAFHKGMRKLRKQWAEVKKLRAAGDSVAARAKEAEMTQTATATIHEAATGAPMNRMAESGDADAP